MKLNKKLRATHDTFSKHCFKETKASLLYQCSCGVFGVKEDDKFIPLEQVATYDEGSKYNIYEIAKEDLDLQEEVILYLFNVKCFNNNSGYKNNGNWNSGDFNSGDRNSGYKNSGNTNSGYCNSGHYNRGDFNSGRWNRGDWNSGSYNSGDSNSGDSNNGNSNSGYCNNGNWNSGNWNNGHFNTETLDTILVFNKPCKRDVWDKATKPSFLFFGLNIWILKKNITAQEKKDNPIYKTTEGYLKTMKYKEAFQHSFDALKDEGKQKQIELLKALPNFDAKVFKEISGIDIK